MVTVLMDDLQSQSSQLPCESPLDATDVLNHQLSTLMVPTPLNGVLDIDVTTEVLALRTPISRPGIPPLHISIPRDLQAIIPPRVNMLEISLPPLAEIKFKPNIAEAYALDSETTIIDENGDLILNFICTPEPWSEIDHMVPFLRLQVSAAVVQGASKILKLLTKAIIPEGEQQTSISLQPPRLYGLLEKTKRNSQYLIISNDHIRSNVPDALQILFHILHGKANDFSSPPKPVLVARVAEVAWLFDCVDSVVPWVQSRLLQILHPKPSVVALQQAYRSGASMRKTSSRPYENVLLSFAMGDQESFLRASLDYVLLTTFPAHDSRVGPSLGIMAILGEHVKSLVDATLEKLTSILNNTFDTFCVEQASPMTPGTAVMLGAYVQSVHRIFGKTSFPVKLTLGPAESLAHVFKRVREIQLSLTDMWKQVKQVGPNVILAVGDDPGVSFGQKVTQVREGMQRLELERYRPGVRQLMDLSHFLFRDLPA